MDVEGLWKAADEPRARRARTTGPCVLQDNLGQAVPRPDFFIIGAPKCGTTALASYLRDHPSVLMSTPKEPHFFSPDYAFGPKYGSELDYVEHCFCHGAKRGWLAVGEASVWYLRSNVAIGRILAFNPDARFIVMLRNPVEMAFSLYSQHVAFGWETRSDFCEAVQADANATYRSLTAKAVPDKVVRASTYSEVCLLGDQLERLFAQVSRDRVMLVFVDDLIADSRSCYLSVVAFLGLEDDGRRVFADVNSARLVRGRLIGRLARNRTLIRNIAAIKTLVGLRAVGFGRPKAEMTALEYDTALRVFREDILRLFELTNRTIPGWLASGKGCRED